MTAIGPGDWVECVDVSNTEGCAWLPQEVLTVGAVYQVAEVFIGITGRPNIGLVGRERPALIRGHRLGYWVSRFRPIYRPKESLLRDLMQPIDTKVDA